MNKPIKDLGVEAMKLSPADRLRLVDIIMASLEPADADVTAAWTEEVRARIADFEAGKYELDDPGDLIAEARAAVRRRA